MTPKTELNILPDNLLRILLGLYSTHVVLSDTHRVLVIALHQLEAGHPGEF